MELGEVAKLHDGDEVFWNDPDDGLCSRQITISQIEIIGDVVRIETRDGDVVECLADELS